MAKTYSTNVGGESTFMYVDSFEFMGDSGMTIEFNGKRAVDIYVTEIEFYSERGETIRNKLDDELDAGNIIYDAEGDVLIKVNLFRTIEDDQLGAFEEDCRELNSAFQKILDPATTKEEFKTFIKNASIGDILRCENWTDYFSYISSSLWNDYAVKVGMRIKEANLPDFKSFLEGKFVCGRETIAELS